MLIEYQDFNGGKNKLGRYAAQCRELTNILTTMPLHLKASSQAGKQGDAIFDPVGTNEYITKSLTELGWVKKIPIPQDYSFLGTDIDFGKNGVLVEVQFSNYPFLLNNVLRSELFYKSKIRLSGKRTALVVIITKAHMFPASNSTLYYEQAEKQLTALNKLRVFSIPIRLVGLFSEQEESIDIVWTEYRGTQSRDVINREQRIGRIIPGKRYRSRCSILWF